jgi:hypothetical protein
LRNTGKQYCNNLKPPFSFHTSHLSYLKEKEKEKEKEKHLIPFSLRIRSFNRIEKGCKSTGTS